MTEKNALRTNITERNDEIKALKSDVKVLEKLRSQLTSKSDQLLNERLELEEQVVSLGLRVSHAIAQNGCCYKFGSE
jgi:predicted nuclease with TOPRIM domain